MVFALKQGKQAASREFWIDTTPLSVEPPLVAVDGTTSYLGNMGCSRLSSSCNRNCLSWSLLFDVSHNTRSTSPSPCFHTPSISLLPSSCRRTRRPFYTSRRHGTRDIHRDNRGPKAKGNGTARFRIKLFSLSYPQRQPFCPGKRYSSGCSCYGEGWFPATLGRVSLSLSLYDWERGNGRDGEDRGFRSRWRESAFQVSLPFTVSSRAAFDIFIFWNYHVQLFLF